MLLHRRDGYSQLLRNGGVRKTVNFPQREDAPAVKGQGGDQFRQMAKLVLAEDDRLRIRLVMNQRHLIDVAEQAEMDQPPAAQLVEDEVAQRGLGEGLGRADAGPIRRRDHADQGVLNDVLRLQVGRADAPREPQQNRFQRKNMLAEPRPSGAIGVARHSCVSPDRISVASGEATLPILVVRSHYPDRLLQLSRRSMSLDI